MGKLPPRLLGGVLLAGSVGSTLVHRSVYEAARYGPAQVAEFGLGLLTFVLASTGILLLIHGARLFKPVPGGLCGEDLRARTVSRARPEESIPPTGRAFDTRYGASMQQARHPIALPRRAPIDRTSSPRR